MKESDLAEFRSWNRDAGPYPYLQRFFPELYKLSIEELKKRDDLAQGKLNAKMNP